MGKMCHPLLKGGRRESKYTHGFPSYDLHTLASICEVFLAPIPQNSVHFSSKGDQTDDHIQSFLKSSGSDNFVPEEVRLYLSYFVSIILIVLV